MEINTIITRCSQISHCGKSAIVIISAIWTPRLRNDYEIYILFIIIILCRFCQSIESDLQIFFEDVVVIFNSYRNRLLLSIFLEG